MNRRAVASAALGSAMLVAACQPSMGGTDVSATLAALRVAPEGSIAGYEREEFGGGWAAQDGECDTRDVVLRRSATEREGDCGDLAGSWVSVYDGEVVTDPGDLDIDHVVPLAEAWRSGAASWNDERREAFANDLDVPQLVAVTSSSNREKSDEDPSGWLPPRARCQYVEWWIAVKTAYDLTVDEVEKVALERTLASCRG